MIDAAAMTPNGSLRKRFFARAAACAGVSVASAIAGPQAASAQSLLELIANQRFSVDDNQGLDPDSPGTTYFSRTGLDAEYQTRNSSLFFRARAGADVSLAAGGGETGDLDQINPRALAEFEVTRENLLLSSSLSVRRRPVSFARIEGLTSDDDGFVDGDDGSVDPPVDDIDVIDGDITSDRADQLDLVFNSGARLALDTVTSASFGVSAAARRFSDDNGGELVESDTFSFDLGLDRAVDARTRLGVSLGASLFDADSGATDQSLTLSAEGTFRRSVNTRMTVSGSAGLSYVTTEFDQSDPSGAGRTDDSTLGFVGGINLGYQPNSTTILALSASQSVSPSSLGEVQNRSLLRFSGSHDINESLRFGAVATASLQQATSSGASSTDRVRLTFSPSLTYVPARDWSVNVGYSFRLSDEEDEGTATSNAAFLSISRKFSLSP